MLVTTSGTSVIRRWLCSRGAEDCWHRARQRAPPPTSCGTAPDGQLRKVAADSLLLERVTMVGQAECPSVEGGLVVVGVGWEMGGGQ